MAKHIMAFGIIAAAFAASGANYHVDAVNGNDAWDGTAAEIPASGTTGPKRTLAGAMSIPALAAGDTVVAAEGNYDDGSMNGYRVRIPEGVKLVAAGAKDATVIKGRYADGVAADASPWGCGTGALRCVYVGRNAHLVGFTVTDGRAEGAATDEASTVGGIGGAADGSLVVDCVVTNCKAGVNAGASGVDAIRCSFVSNAVLNAVDGSAQDMAGGKAWNCHFPNGRDPAIGSAYKMRPCNGTSLYNCRAANDLYDCRFYNCRIGSPISGKLYCTYYYKLKGDADPKGIATCEDGRCVSVIDSQMQYDDNGRPIPGSNNGIGMADMSYYYRDASEAVMAYLDRDLAGGQRVTHGRLDIGACQLDDLGTDAYAMVGGATNRFTFVSEPTNGVPASEDATIFEIPGAGELVWRWRVDFDKVDLEYAIRASMSGEGSLVFYLDDAAVPFATATEADGWQNISYTNATTHYVRAVVTGGGTAKVSMLNWTTVCYVNPNTGVNAADRGSSKDTPYLTIRYALDNMRGISPGKHCLLYAMPGIYNSDTYNKARLRVFPKQKLVATGSKDETIIEGTPDYTGNVAGCGANAIYAIIADTNSYVAGFTIRNGFSGVKTTAGGGVSGPTSVKEGATSPVVYDCIITNCCAHNGGAIANAIAINCRIVGNGCTSMGASAYLASCYNCAISHNWTTNGASNAYNCYKSTLVGCTALDGDGITSGERGCTAYNSYLQNARAADKDPSALYNCAYGRRDTGVTVSRCTKLDAADLDLDENFRATRRSSMLYNKGNNDYVSIGLPAELIPLVQKDFAMGPRILDDVVDIGCGEYEYIPSGMMMLVR